MKIVNITVLPLLFLSSCTNQTAWEPSIDMDQEGDPKALLEDRNYCQEHAFAASTRPHATPDKETFGVAALAGIAGAALGSLLGSAKQGASVGTAAGVHAFAGDREYRRTYTRCLVDRGHAVLNP